MIFPQEGKIPNSPSKKPAIHWYPPGPIARAFMNDPSFICGVMGPFGSGKSVTAMMKLIKNAQSQKRAADGWIYRRTAIIRNTYPELRTTTMKTWHQWVPQHLGKWREAGPPCHHIIDPAQKLNWEVIFVSLDRPDDVAKLLGMELSDALIDEAREVPKAILDGLTGRVGRYPAQWQAPATSVQILMVTNPPDTDHWWYTLAEQDIGDEKKRQLIQSMHEAEETLRTLGVLKKNQRLMSFYKQPSGRSENAENKNNLRPGYYEFLMAGKDADWIKVYVDGEYGFVMDGLPIYPEYKDSLHSAVFDVVPGLPFRLGFDWGLTPAASISQRMADGRWKIVDEYVSERMGIKTFADGLARHLAEKWPGMKVFTAYGDPSGDAVTPEESTCFNIMRANGFPMTQPAPTNDPTRRKEGMQYLLKTIIDGVPAIQFHQRVHIMRKGMAGGYHRKRLQVAGDIRYRDVPDKNKFSHVIEALEYDIVSAGEDRNVTVMADRIRGPREAYANSDYNILGG